LVELEAHQRQYINRLRELKGENDVYYYKQVSFDTIRSLLTL
jgi:hypothetical protein